MINIGKQIEYWISTAKSDLDSAELLIRESRYSHVVKTTGEIPPNSHNLIYLLELAGIELDESDEDFLGILMKY